MQTPQSPCASPHSEPSFKITSRPDLADWLNTCPSATTAYAWAPSLGHYILWPVRCKRWSCPFCARKKIGRLAHRVEDAQPNRLLTLTLDPSRYESPRHAFDQTRRRVPELFRSLRPKFGPIEYLRVTEITRKGWPHYHCLIRSGFLPHACVRDRWKDLTGAQIVDLRQVQRSFSAYSYLVKYLAKMHHLGWTERHLSFTRNFFPPEQKPPSPMPPHDRARHEKIHPVTFLCRYYAYLTIRRMPGDYYILPPVPDDFMNHALPDADVLPVTLRNLPEDSPLRERKPDAQQRLFTETRS